jgi:hypothetical protein
MRFDSMPRTKCGCLEQVNDQLEDHTDGHQIVPRQTYSPDGGTSWELPLYATRYTDSGNPKRGAPVYLSLCPFCGEELEFLEREENKE